MKTTTTQATDKQIQIQAIETFFESLDTEVDIVNHIDINQLLQNIEQSKSESNNPDQEPFETILYELQDRNAFDIEIIYYSNAMKYLSENDPSLSESLEIAAEFGMPINDINSETLASLHASQRAAVEFNELEDEINDFFTP